MLRRLLPAVATACAFLTLPSRSSGEEALEKERELTVTQTAPEWPLNDNTGIGRWGNNAKSSAWMEFLLDDPSDIEEESSSSDGPENISEPGKLEIELVIGDKRPDILHPMRSLKPLMIVMLVFLVVLFTKALFSDDGSTQSESSGMGGVVLEDTANIGDKGRP